MLEVTNNVNTVVGDVFLVLLVYKNTDIFKQN